jgi:hypothetical protein
MAQRVQYTLVCDVHGDETPGTETISFALGSAAYEIDLCDAHANAMRDAFAPYVGTARRSGRTATGVGRRGRRGGTSTTVGYDPAAVRAWARSNGIKVSERGRISADVVEQFHAAGH